MTSTTFDRTLERVGAGERLQLEEIRALAASPDILQLGMLADALARRLHGGRTTYLRVAFHALDAPPAPVPPGSREVRITGAPESLDSAVAAVASVRAHAEDRVLSAFSWDDVARLARDGAREVRDVLVALRAAGLDAIASLAMDEIPDGPAAIGELLGAGFERLTLTVSGVKASDAFDLWSRASDLQQRFGCVRAIDPLPARSSPARPTTGYQDVKAVALARLLAADVPTIQVDWMRYGPKLAQVALTFGADDVWGVSASDEAPEGRRRAPVEEIRRNIEAAGFAAIERDGRFTPVD